ncbi:MAG: DEAD/DEAH box helicase [Polyangiaceae bacterium]
MDTVELEALGPELSGAMLAKGYTSLTPVQSIVLDPAFVGRDLRVSSQTGSGKTVAIGFIVRHQVTRAPEEQTKASLAQPRALVLTPTRELARQVQAELAWLFEPIKARVAAVTGGTSYRTEHRALAANPEVVVGTPGRLLDQLRRGAIDPSGLAAIVLDEADRMLDMGFRDDIEAVLALAPAERRTHLVSATFPRDVCNLADRVQRDPVHVQGTPLGAANADIDHVIHLVEQDQRLDALVNLLIMGAGRLDADPESAKRPTPASTLVFAQTRSDVAEITDRLLDLGFRVRALSGDLEQRDRDRALEAFKRGELDALVATDVAARGIDVQDVARVIQVDPPADPDSYTHRSGRTGRAGRKGLSVMLVTPRGLNRVTHLLRRAGIQVEIKPIPSPARIREARDERVLAELTRTPESGDATDPAADPSGAWMQTATRIASAGNVTIAIARLLAMSGRALAEPREVEPIQPPRVKATAPHLEAPRAPRPRAPLGSTKWVRFRISWGEAHGADARRILAMVCRRGGVDRGDVGTIEVRRVFSTVDVAESVAEAFAAAASQPDPRDPRVSIRRAEELPPPPPSRAAWTEPPPKPAVRARAEDGPRKTSNARPGPNSKPKKPHAAAHPAARKRARGR